MVGKRQGRWSWDDSRIAFAIILITTGVTVTIVVMRILFSPRDDITKVGDIISSAVLGLAVGIASTSGRIWVKLNDATKLLNSATTNLEAMAGAARAQASEYEIRHTIERYREIPRKAANELMTHHYKAITAKKSYISLDTHNTAVLFNTEFWRQLTSRQAELHIGVSIEDKKSGFGALSVDITHRASIDFWTREDATKSLNQQGDFIAAGGSITRIIEGPVTYNDIFEGLETVIETTINNDDDTLTRYRKVISNMIGKGIDVRYISVGYKKGSTGKDFLIVDMKEDQHHDDMTMIWYLKDEVIVTCNLLIDNLGKEDSNSGDYHFSEDIRSLREEWRTLNNVFVEQQRARKSLKE